jgi:hypothetical protein
VISLELREMTTTRTKTVVLAGLLRSEDGQLRRHCKVRADRHEIFVSERDEPVKISYCRVSIAGSDDWPDCEYNVTYRDQKEFLTKKHGYYLVRGVLT